MAHVHTILHVQKKCIESSMKADRSALCATLSVCLCVWLLWLTETVGHRQTASLNSLLYIVLRNVHGGETIKFLHTEMSAQKK